MKKPTDRAANYRGSTPCRYVTAYLREDEFALLQQMALQQRTTINGMVRKLIVDTATTSGVEGAAHNA